MVCGGKLEYLVAGREFQCVDCGQRETGYVYCAGGHYICEDCHGKRFFENILDLLFSAKGSDPVLIAEEIIKEAAPPMLGCEHAWIAAGALMSAIRNYGEIKVTDGQIAEALHRTRRQAVGAYCGLTGVCGVAVGIGASFSVLLGAACPKDRETAITMHVVSRVIEAIAGQAGPCCCKNFLRTALILSCRLLKEHFNVDLPYTGQITCAASHRHPHGCRETKCSYYPQLKKTEEDDWSVFTEYDAFFANVYGEETALDRKTKHLVALAASLAAGCEP
ncbi:MAG: carboxymuconolactone decarboxylase family protein [Firmicutes bacterium]|nr:carboxymuconolactone decarboxylase family protein [Bacillota bacterium]